MHIHDRCEATLRHLCFGDKLSCLRFTKLRYYCPRCGHSHMQDVPFQAKGHRISSELLNFTRDLLAYGFTNKQVAYITGLGRNTVKDIDLKRLKEKYTVDGERLIQPERQARFLGIDEFKLHDGHKYAVIIIDMETGHILWLAHGKKKASVYSFIEHVGKEWMEGVEAVACDMNSDFQEAFEDRCPHIQTVFDFFHIVKNFNDKVVGQIRKDEQRRLIAEGDEKAAKSLKGSRYILTSSKQTLARKDQEAEDGKILSEGSSLFSKEQVVRKDGHLARYEDLIRQNKLLFTLDLIKEKLCEAYKMTDEPSMAGAISEIMDMCMATGNKHLLWFRRLLDNHFEGIIAHATYDISAGKIEGVNNRIKTLRRQGYGYPDDDYFFLKLFDASRKGYVRNPVAEKIPQDL
ncbi:MAG: ISL3 family transposase [Sphaerochaeta sp.]|nr:ISL3 family transposase [Sphaerochaeta sp.]